MIRRPAVCVVSDIPKLFDSIKSQCSHMCNSITAVDPNNVHLSDKSLLSEAEIIISEPHYAKIWMENLSKLKLVLGTWAGIDSMVRLTKERKITPTFTYCRFGGRYGQAIGEYVISYTIAQERNMRLTYESQALSKWARADVIEHITSDKSRSLNNLTMGILGLGEIGKTVAKMCKGVGMKVWGLVNTVPSDESKCPYVDEYRTSSELDTILSSCDYICNILPSTSQTRSLLDNKRLKACEPKQAVFINVGRGDICTEQSILHALQKRWLRAAILDVLPTEPLPPTSPLWLHPDVTITPHVSAVSVPQKNTDLIVENIENYIHGRQLKFVIDWEKEY